MYILILVDEDKPADIVTPNMKIQYVQKGQMIVGLRFKNERPYIIIDCIKRRTLGANVEFSDWWNRCVVPTCKNIIKGDRR